MEGAAQTLVKNAGKLLATEYRQLSGVGGEVVELRDDLDTMDALLRMQSEADEGAVDHFVRVWMKQLREVAYDAEDCIDLYLLRIKGRVSDGVFAKLKHRLRTLLPRRRLASKISSLRARAVAISERHARYGVNRDALLRRSPAASSAAPMLMASTGDGQEALSLSNSANDSSRHQVIGINDQVESLAERLKAVSAEGERHLKVCSIVGFGGVGKTTLATELCRVLKADFPYQAFVSVSQAFDPSKDLKPLLRRVLEQIVKTKAGVMEEGSLGNIDNLDSNQLAKQLEERLKDKR
ncbi:hypothetical protein PR202_gb12438 [Eleusine coracana subsp. coracana]|uniref:Uncharacterized protein n=1 Tax=Eleusine coracana subsp. coracana TaxID=191504 RepID=A0AAV5EQI8_ELECO|nr:hypothetical protein PR202_gb12438 [Eleusine coracana subsp. coracana]